MPEAAAPSTHGAAQSWHGKGPVRVARAGDRTVVRFRSLSSQAGRLKARLGDLFRKQFRELRPSYESFAVTIWIERAPGRGAFDVDNVAKACLDVLTGVLWHDDRQVLQLSVSKLPAEANAITLLAEPFRDSAGEAAAERLRLLLGELDGVRGSRR